MTGDVLSLPALGRALLARQGLLERWKAPLVDVVESVGALQAQHWPALPVALWSRMDGFTTESLYDAFEQRRLVVGTLLRGTLHAVSAREYADYVVAADAAGANDWRRMTKTEPSPQVATLRADLRAYAADTPRSDDEIAVFLDEWVVAHPGVIDDAEVEAQRSRKWRPFRRTSDFVRAPADGRWGSKTPSLSLAAPRPPATETPEDQEALATVVRRHLRAFGPAAAEDVASWIGWRTPPVRKLLDGLELPRFTDEVGRTLYDLPDAPRPDPEIPAPPRFLAMFDSVLLAYASARRQRILPDAYKDAVYQRANLRVLPTFLVDGLVAGTWSMEAKRREATITLKPFGRFAGPVRKAVLAEAERLVRFSHPAVATHHVTVDG